MRFAIYVIYGSYRANAPMAAFSRSRCSSITVTMAPQADGVHQVTMGPYVAARLNTPEEAQKAVRALKALASELADSREISALAEAYFDLLARRRGLVEQLSPIAMDKWAVDGRCEWCPGPA